MIIKIFVTMEIEKNIELRERLLNLMESNLEIREKICTSVNDSIFDKAFNWIKNIFKK